MQPSARGLQALRALAYGHSAPCLAIQTRTLHSTVHRSEKPTPKISFGAEGDAILASYVKKNTRTSSTPTATSTTGSNAANGHEIIVKTKSPSQNPFFPPVDNFEIPSFIDRSKQPVAKPRTLTSAAESSPRPPRKTKKQRADEIPSPAATKLKERFARARERIENEGTGWKNGDRRFIMNRNTAAPTRSYNTTTTTTCSDQPPTARKTRQPAPLPNDAEPVHDPSNPHIAQPIVENPKIRLSGPRRALEDWEIQRAALKRKFAGQPWAPRKRLSPDALDGIRALHDSDPQKYSTPVLAEQFEVSAEAIRRILSSKWRPSEEEAARRREAWARRHDRIWDHMAELGLRPQRTREKEVMDEAQAADEFADELNRKRILGVME